MSTQVATGTAVNGSVGPGGVDKGKGGKYVFLPPGYDRTQVPDGYISMLRDRGQDAEADAEDERVVFPRMQQTQCGGVT